MECVDSKEDPLMQIVGTHQHNINSAMLQSVRRLKIELQRGTRQIKDSIAEKIKERWQGWRIYGQLPRNLKEKLEDNEESYRWLKSGDIKGETESTIVTAQDQAISTNYFKNESLKEEIESKCRSYKQHKRYIKV